MPLRLRSLVVLMLPVGQLGCGDLLGLEELSFEEPDVSQYAASGSGGAGVSTGGANQGSAGDPVVIQATGGHRSELVIPDFPAVWPKGVLITALIGEEENSPYWFYDPEAERLHSFLSLPDRADPQSVRSWKGEWSHFIAYETNEGRRLLGYDSALGLASELLSVEGEDELVEQTSPAGSRDRTHLLSLDVNGEAQVFVYSRESGSFRFFSAESPGNGEVCMGTWDTGWDQVVPYRKGENEGVLLFSADTGMLRFESLNPCDPEASTQFSLDLSSLPKLIFSFPEAGTSSLYFYHQNGVVRNVVLTDGAGGAQWGEDLDDGIWREGLSAIVPLRVHGSRHAITYDGTSGVAELRSLEELTDDLGIVIK